jgi:hypothetical protein
MPDFSHAAQFFFAVILGAALARAAMRSVTLCDQHGGVSAGTLHGAFGGYLGNQWGKVLAQTLQNY